MKDYDPHEAIDFIFKTAPQYAKASGELAQLENFRHSLKAIKMSQTEEQSLGHKNEKHTVAKTTKTYAKPLG